MKHIATLAAGLAAMAAATTWAAVPDMTAVVRADQPGHTIPETLYGIFFEDINYAADGGIYAELVANPRGKFFNVAYEIPPSITQGKSKVTVRFQAKGEALAGGLFGLRVVLAPSVKQFAESDAPF